MKYLLFSAFFLLILSWLMPNHYVPWLASHSEFLAFLFGLMVLLFLCLNYKEIKLPVKYFFVLFLGFIPVVQWVMGCIYFFGDAVVSSIYLISFFIMLILGYNIGKDNSYRNFIILLFFAAILFSSVVSVYISLLQWLDLTNGSIWIAELPHNRPFGNFAQPNTMSTFSIMGVIAVIFLYEKEYFNKFLAYFVITFLIFGVALTQSRTAWIALPSLIVLFWWFGRSKLFFKFNYVNLIVINLIFILFVISLPFFSKTLNLVDIHDAVNRASTGHNRFYLWQQLLLAAWEKPWFGYGWNQVGVAQVEITLTYGFPEWITHSHNILLDFIIWMGIPLGILTILFLFLWIYQLVISVNSIESVLVLIMIFVVFNHSMFEFPLEYSFFLLPVGFLIGFIQVDDSSIKSFDVDNDFFWVLFFISILLFMQIFKEYRAIEKDVQLARFELLNIGDIHSPIAAPNVLFLTQLSEQLRYMRTKPRKNMSPKQLEWMRKVAYRYATQAALFRYAQALALNDHKTLADQQLVIIYKLHGKKIAPETLYQTRDSLAFSWENNQSESNVDKSLSDE